MFTVRKVVLAAALGCANTWYFPAHANVGESYGFGSRNSALAGAGAASATDGYSAYLNPAGLAATGGPQGDKTIRLNYGVVSMQPRFLPIDDVVIENKTTSDRVSRGSVDVDYRPTFGQSLGFALRPVPEWWNLSVGITAFLPISQMAYVDSGESFIPEYVLYRARTQRPQFDFGAGIQPLRGAFGGLYLGAGARSGFALTSNAKVFLQGDSSKPSSMRFASSLKPKLAPVIGVAYATGDDPERSRLVVGGVWRMAIASPSFLTVNAATRIFGDLAAVDVQVKSNAILYYDPMSFETGVTWSQTSPPSDPSAKMYLQLDYQLWSRYQPPAVSIQTEDGSVFSSSSGPRPEFRDILVPRVGEELTFGRFAVRAGYAYRPSSLRSRLNNSLNYLDPAKHMLSAGAGIRLKDRWTLDFHAAYQHLMEQTITKDGSEDIGAPGYRAGGKIFGGGVSLGITI